MSDVFEFDGKKLKEVIGNPRGNCLKCIYIKDDIKCATLSRNPIRCGDDKYYIEAEEEEIEPSKKYPETVVNIVNIPLNSSKPKLELYDSVDKVLDELKALEGTYYDTYLQCEKSMGHFWVKDGKLFRKFVRGADRVGIKYEYIIESEYPLVISEVVTTIASGGKTDITNPPRPIQPKDFLDIVNEYREYFYYTGVEGHEDIDRILLTDKGRR